MGRTRGIGGYSGGLLRAERDIGWGSDMWQWDSLAVRTFPVVLEGKKERSGEGREDFFQQIGEF